mgnify:CR=1 FL=1
MSSMPFLVKERRSTRSEEAYKAITHQLEHVLKLHGLRNFTLSASNGLVLAKAGHTEESEALAAYAPMLAKCLDRNTRNEVVEELGQVVPMGERDTVTVRSFFIEGERFYLGLVGHAGTLLDASLYRALTGIRRIFKQNA